MRIVSHGDPVFGSTAGVPNSPMCQECKRHCLVLVEMGSHSEDEYGPEHYCVICIETAYLFARGSKGR